MASLPERALRGRSHPEVSNPTDAHNVVDVTGVFPEKETGSVARMTRKRIRQPRDPRDQGPLKDLQCPGRTSPWKSTPTTRRKKRASACSQTVT